MPDEPTAKPRVYVSAFFCQSTLREKDSGVLTAIRISDAYTVTPLLLPAAKPLFLPLDVQMVVMFKSEEPETLEVDMKAFDPAGNALTAPYHKEKIQTFGGAAGHTLNVLLTLPTHKAGEFWVEIYVDGELKTKLPLRIIQNIPDATPQTNPAKQTEPVASE